MLSRKAFIALWILLSITATAFGVAARNFHRYHRIWFKPAINTGLYAGSIDRTPPPYNPNKRPSRPWLDPKRVAPPLTTYHAYAASAINGQQTDCLLYLPPGYDDPANASRRYPVIYWLHGYSAAPQWGMPFVETLDEAIRAGIAPPIIAVLPNGLHDSWYVDSVDAAQPVESIIIKDLIPHIDATLRTIPDRRSRAVEGFSMGAWGAAHLAFKYPELFCSATLVATPLHTHASFPQFGRIFNSQQADFYAEDPVTRLHRNAAQLKDTTHVRVLIGDQDYTIHFARAFAPQLEQLQIPYEMTIVPGVGHDDDGVYRAVGAKAFSFYKDLFSPSALIR